MIYYKQYPLSIAVVKIDANHISGDYMYTSRSGKRTKPRLSCINTIESSKSYTSYNNIPYYQT